MTATITAYDAKAPRKSVFAALAEARRNFGGDALVDIDERVLTYDQIMRASLALGHALAQDSASGEWVGLMLPTGAGAAIGFFALAAFGRVPAMLNFSTGIAGVQSAIRTARLRRVVTARRFVERAGLEALIAALDVEIVYLEDVRARLSLSDKLAAAMGQVAPRLVVPRVDPGSPAVVLFTSGTEGEPKGVVLSHRNLLANVAQVRDHIALERDDILFNPLPVFHCFGLTVGLLLPLIAGVKTVCHPTPLQPHEIVRRMSAHGATILLSTDTFISQYARAGGDDDLANLRLAVCGAERLRDETRRLVRKKYGIELLEGYGVTEASPVIAANRVEANRSGTVGTLMAGMEARLEPVEGISGAGRLFVRGPNIMLGYVLSYRPGMIVPPPDGWHDTGDVVSIDAEGFIEIRGRLKRFAKIGGETVSLAMVENCASALWPGHAHAAITLPDGARGEEIVLVTDAQDARRLDLTGWVHAHGVSDLAVPRRILVVGAIPILATGKTDYVEVEKMAREIA